MSDVESLRTVDGGWSYLHHIDKETLVKLAQPAATALLAISITTLPLVVQAGQTLGVHWAGSGYEPVKVQLVD
tara:strand:- start:1346 stop:1564 length:219 start_codon:yes stop_codon:yes gene_type:complete